MESDEMTEFTSEFISICREEAKVLEDDGYKAFTLALDHIEKQAKRIEELEQERRWIPVGERLPEDSRIYDVAIADYEYSWTGTCVFGKWIGESGKAILGVTHWKYRPQPPKEEE
jgi:hypothetical protein